MQPSSSPGPLAGQTENSNRLSYKFQRLREQLRAAIVAGELGARLPGERELGRRFGANAKTINKALRDLTSEGLLVRQIGRGTYVASSGAPELAPHRLIRCLKVVHPSTAVERSALLEAVRSEFQPQGHRFELTCVDENAGQRMPISAWPAAARTETDALVIHTDRPLSRRAEGLSEALIEEAYRRHTPTVVLGGCAGAAKLNAVVPDYTDGGFRLCDHLVRLGCRMVVAVSSLADGREDELVLAGARSAAMRHGVALHHAVLDRCDRRQIADLIGAAVEASNPRKSNGHPLVIGLMGIGRPALEAINACETQIMKDSAVPILKAVMLDADDPVSAPEDWSSYEVEAAAMARWTAKLVLDTRPGLRPTEVWVPGKLRMMSRRDVGSSNGHGNGNGHGRHSPPRIAIEEILIDAVVV